MNLRQSMAGLHTWGGLLPIWLLYVIIFAGTLACFDKELNRWMRPALHQVQATSVSADAVRGWLQRNVKDELHAFWLHAPDERQPFWRLGWEIDKTEEIHNVAIDPVTGESMTETVGGDFFFELHYALHAGQVGIYIVGLAGMFMLVALVSGVIIHRRIFKDFFTLRPNANGQRAWLDAHNLFGVVGFPFHLVLAYTGLAIFVSNYMPAGVQVAYQNNILTFFSEVMGSYDRESVGKPTAQQASLDELIERSRQHWGGGEVGWVSVHHPGDEAGVVDVRLESGSRIAAPQATLSYDDGTGALLNEQKVGNGYKTYAWLTGLHMAQFGGSLVRLLYLLLGFAGCAMLIGGVQVWLSKREARGGRGIGLVRSLNGAVFAGLPLASLALLWGNRLIPAGVAERASAESWVFVGSWVLIAAWSAVRHQQPRKLLVQQLLLGAVLALGLPVLNALTTNHGSLLSSLSRGDWALAAIDLFLLGSGVLCALCAWRLGQSQPSKEPRARRAMVEEAV
ncbi:MAG TPA: PepSY-associated TM helix domain-containing protein [Pseudomonas sp.]|nr:PepSY-associated TM helix domain-containing protein [Pseudomonas sp.]